MRQRLFPLLLLTTCCAVACKQSTPVQPAEAAPAPSAQAHAGHDHAAHQGAASAATKAANAPEGRVFFIEPAAGAQLTSPFKVRFGIEGRTVRPAGEDINDQSSGHHHLIIDDAAPSAGTVVPKDATHIHYGGGQTEAMVTLSPGHHKLTMQLADGAHRSYGPAWSATIEVDVKAPAE